MRQKNIPKPRQGDLAGAVACFQAAKHIFASVDALETQDGQFCTQMLSGLLSLVLRVPQNTNTRHPGKNNKTRGSAPHRTPSALVLFVFPGWCWCLCFGALLSPTERSRKARQSLGHRNSKNNADTASYSNARVVKSAEAPKFIEQTHQIPIFIEKRPK